LSPLSDDTILDIEAIHALNLPTRAHNILAGDYVGVPVGELRIDLTRRLARIRNCGKATRGIILAALDGEPMPVTQQAINRQISRVRKEAAARVAQLRAQHLALEPRP
jgi:hypothetical protein